MKKRKKSFNVVIAVSQVKPKFKIDDVVVSKIHSGEFIISNIYLRNGIIFYRLILLRSLFHMTANELYDDIYPNDFLVEERYLEHS